MNLVHCYDGSIKVEFSDVVWLVGRRQCVCVGGGGSSFFFFFFLYTTYRVLLKNVFLSAFDVALLARVKRLVAAGMPPDG